MPRVAWLLVACLFSLASVRSDLVINELHYSPDVKTDPVEFVELYNAGTTRVDLAGWALADGVAFQFPAGTSIGPGEFLVVGEDPEALRARFGVTGALGPWIGRLANEGENVVLRDAVGEVVDQVEYQLGFPWPTVGDAPGYSIELVNPAFDNNLGGNWRASVAGAVTPQQEALVRERSDWRYFKGTQEPSSPVTAWREAGFDDSSWLMGSAPIGFGENFIATRLDDMRGNYGSVFARLKFNVPDPAKISELLLEARYDDGLKVWINGQSVVSANLPAGEVPFDATAASAIENGEFVPFPLGAGTSRLVAGENVIALQVHNSSVSASSDLFFDVRLTSQTGPASRGPTPGRMNSVYTENLPPQIRQVAHEPRAPVSGQPVTITAKMTDGDGMGNVSLEYQVVEPGNYIALEDAAYRTSWTSVPMTDSGGGIDAIAGDGIFSAELPGSLQQHRRLVRYRLTAADAGGRSITVPFADDPQPNFAYFVYDGVPAWSGAIQPGNSDPVRGAVVAYGTDVMRRLPVYHLISKKSSVEDCTWYSGYGGDLYRWKGTLVFDGEVYDHIGYRARGGVWRYAMGKNMWKFDFNRGHDFEARDNNGRRYSVNWTKLNLGACIQQGDYQHRGEQGMFEAVGFRLFNLVGVESPKTHFVQFRIIDEAQESDPASQYNGDFWGLYLAVEQEDGRFLDEHGLPDGNFYKMEGGSGELNNQGATGVTDKSDLRSFMSTYLGSPTDDWWRQNFSLDRYYSYQAIVQGIHHYDICYGKNYFYFLNPDTGIWSVHPWDLDLTWADNMFDAGCGGVDDFMNRVLPRPAFTLEFQNRIREIRDLLFNTDQAWQLIDEYAAMIDDPTGAPSFVDADRAMWDYHPIMASSIVNRSKAGQGRFYQVVPTKDFPGMVSKMKNYVVARSALLDQMANDPLIPDLPVIQPVSETSIPTDQLTFRAAPYSGPNPFAAMKWRIGEMTPSESPSFNPSIPRRYEIEPVWESAELAAFTPEIMVPADAVKIGHTYRLRLRMKDNAGRWSHWSEPVVFTTAPAGSAASLEENLRITELMVNPPAGSDYEFIELHNVSDSQALDLAGVTFTQGIGYTFPAGTTLPPRGYVLVVPVSDEGNFAGFRAFYGLGTEVSIAGPYSGALNNAGEPITLKTAAGGATILSFEYGDGRGWPVAADGAGHSLVPLAAAIGGGGGGQLDYPGNWRASSFRNGSSGRADPAALLGPVLNEVAAHTESAGATDSNDWIELYNPTAEPLPLGPSWFLSDDPADLKKWEIPADTVIPVRGWVRFDEVAGFHNPPTVGFGLSKSGEQVLLSHLPGNPSDRVVDSVKFKAQESGGSYGRFPDGAPWWSGLAAQTPNAANSPPPLSVTITEVMFRPKEASAGEDNLADEYVEVFNPTASPVDLFNATGPWRLDGGVEFLFPPGITLEPGNALLVVSFDPDDSATRNAFLTRYGLDGTKRLVGPYAGKLSNSSDRVALEKPHPADATNAPPAWGIVDEVIYSDRAPWPDGADGTGLSLHRTWNAPSGNDPVSWRSAEASPGTAEPPQTNPDADGDGMPDAWELTHGLNSGTNDAAADSDGDGLSNIEEYQAGTDPQDSASALRLEVAISDQGAVRLRFVAVARKGYVASSCDQLTGEWQVLHEAPPAGATGVLEITDPRPLNGQRFYRVQVK